MEHFKRYFDDAYESEGTFLEVPVELVESVLNAETSSKSRVSDDLTVAYLCNADQQVLLEKFKRFGITPDILDCHIPGRTPIRDLSPPHWI